MRASLSRTAPGLLEFMDLARQKFDARVSYVETPETIFGRRPDWLDDAGTEWKP